MDRSDGESNAAIPGLVQALDAAHPPLCRVVVDCGVASRAKPAQGDSAPTESKSAAQLPCLNDCGFVSPVVVLGGGLAPVAC